MRKELLTAVVMGFVSFTAVAQENERPDSTEYVLSGKHRISGCGAMLLSSGSAGLSNDIYTEAGFGGGVLVDQRVFLGFYGRALTSPEFHQEILQYGRAFQGTLRVNHGGVWAMYSFTPQKSIHPFLGAQIGWGTAEWTFDDPYDEDEGYVPDSLRGPENIKDHVMALMVMGGAEFNVTRWFRPNVYLGMRSVTGLSLPTTTRTDLDGFLVGVNLCFGGFGDRRK